MRGRLVADTREAGPEDRLAGLLAAVGARVLSTPGMRIVGPGDEAPLRAAVAALESFDWIVLASANAARSLLSATESAGVNVGSWSPRICVVGPGTREVVEDGGWGVHLVAGRFLAEGILEALVKAGGVEGKRILVPRAAQAPGLLCEGLERLGAEVVVVEAYRNVADVEGLQRLRSSVEAGEVDVVALTAASVARRVAGVLRGVAGEVRIAVIGPSTAAAARESGLEVHAVAEPHSLEGLVEACGRAVQSRREADGPSGRGLAP